MKSRVKANTSLFSDIKTEAEAYWLGFLFTDGCLSDTKVIFNIAGKDAEHLGKFAEFIGSDRVPRLWVSKTGFPRATFTVTSFLIADSLRKAGMHDNKTWTITPWIGEHSLLRHFWRGCIDGDGSIHLSSHPARGVPRSVWRLHFCGNEAMVSGFRDYVSGILGINVNLQKQGKAPSGNQLYCVQYSEKHADAIAQHLYVDSTISLDRKAELAKQLHETRLTRKGVVEYVCSHEDCNRKAVAKKMCNSHWRKQYRESGLDRQRSNYLVTTAA